VPATVSVVIPVKNDALLLAQCLDALARQTVTPREIVVVDNGSTDDSVEVAQAAGARVIRETTPGIPAASSAGYDAALGDIIARLDADCVPPPDWVQRLRDDLSADPGLAAVTGGAIFYDGPRRLRGVLAALYLGSYFAVFYPTLAHFPLFGSNLGLRRSAWLGISGEVHRGDTRLHDDIDLSFHLGPERRIRFDPRLRIQISMRALQGDQRLRVVRGYEASSCTGHKTCRSCAGFAERARDCDQLRVAPGYRLRIMTTRILLLADTHLPKRARVLPDRVWREIEQVDLVLHAGDWVDARLLDEVEARSARLVGVWGNNDGPELRARLPEVARVEIEGVAIVVVHETGPAAGREARCDERYPEADVVVFGHSHIPWDTVTPGGIRLLNPGSPTDRRRQPKCSYLICEIDNGALTKCQLIRFDREAVPHTVATEPESTR
jgi:putative phosphoesterase